MTRRVESGGHNIPLEVIRRRYERGQRNLTQLYLPLCDTWIIYDNSEDNPRLIAALGINQQLIIDDPETFQQITANPNE